ncbi:MAG: GNAT family N-acetyltransferase [Sphingobacteriaceae bacterium]|jgi:predicted GNAT family N-acyltransferase
MSITIEPITNAEMLQSAFQIRRDVFVKEQMVNEAEEYDQEEESTHFLALYNEIPVGTARYRKTVNGIKLERFAILKPYRSMGVGSAILHFILKELNAYNGQIYLHAQLTAIGLYSKFGFESVGEQFEEAGIQHYQMIFKRI